MHEDQQLRLNPLRSAPNLLTLMRMCMAPFLVAAILEGHFLLSFILFVVAGLTDALDGLLARALKQRSVLGHYLDPVADKLLLSTLFLVLFYKGLMPVTVTVLVFGRDVGHPVGFRHSLRGRGPARVLSQHLWQGKHARPDQRRGGRAAASAFARGALGRGRALHRPWRHHWAYHRFWTALCVVGFASQRNSGRQRRHSQIGRRQQQESKLLVQGSASRNLLVAGLRFRRFLQFPYREILRNRRPRHTPGTRHTRCRRAGKRSGPWGVCRRLPSSYLSGAPAAIPRFRIPLRMNSGLALPGGSFHLRVLAFGYGSLGNGYRCSFRQIVAVFCSIANGFFDESPKTAIAMAAGTDVAAVGVPRLEGDFKRTYTEYGPNKSHISC